MSIKKPAFSRGNMVRNKATGKLFYILETPLRARIFVGATPCYAISPWISRSTDKSVPEDNTVVIYEQATAESLFVTVL
jgi:hypothetical protein